MKISEAILAEYINRISTYERMEINKILDENANEIEILNLVYQDSRNFKVEAKIVSRVGGKTRNIKLEFREGKVRINECSCYHWDGLCEHELAVLKYVSKSEVDPNSKEYIEKMKKREFRIFEQISNILYNEKIEDINSKDNETGVKKLPELVKISPIIVTERYSNSNYRLEFKIGYKHMYKIKNITEFTQSIQTNSNFKYGEKLEFEHRREAFDQDSQKYIDLICKYGEIIKYALDNAYEKGSYYGKTIPTGSIPLNERSIDDIYDMFKGKAIIAKSDYVENIKFDEQNRDQKFFKLTQINDIKYNIELTEEACEMRILQGKQNVYISKPNEIIRCNEDFDNITLPLIAILRNNHLKEVAISNEQLTQLFSVVMPNYKDTIEIEEKAEKSIEVYKPKELGVKVYLDFDEQGYLIADVKFCYGDIEINPIIDGITKSENKINIPRNTLEEAKVLNTFISSGFMKDEQRNCFIIVGDEIIYNFLSNDIEYYMQKFEVMVTDEFKKKQIRQPQMGTIGVRIENNLLELDLTSLDIDIDEISEIMSKYKLKKKFHKLKDGSFLELQDNNQVDFIDKIVDGMDVDYSNIENGTIEIPAQRTLYLNQLLKGLKNTKIVKDQNYKNIVNEFNKENLEEELAVPKSLEDILRSYQKIGYKWLTTLDKYKFGGVLADDMGLGKTIQLLSVIKQYFDNTPKKERKASLVICPSSLSLNWQKEAEKFTKGIKTLVITGKLSDRKSMIKDIKKYDLVIVSYDLLKRDIDLYLENKYSFKYIIADEAQYLKNSKTQNAQSIKKLKSETRFALTGTPIENSLSELWSIFDFIMPNYLFSYKKFKQEFEIPIVKDDDEKTMNKLRMLIEPFVLRRTKKEVLTELPEKTISVMNNKMEDEQKKIYVSYVARVKKELAQSINEVGVNKSRMQVLAALTRLRQICCHPSLFIEDYTSGSSKLDQCMEIVEEGIEGGHKILLFSSYTSMFTIIEKKLEEKGIKYFKLTGKTKVAERIKMVEDFNKEQSVKVFLISIKAGGTGLNLTGADMVIHYDPWWNLSVENQATDRAYRIGQKNNVQVYKLITKDSIEEKINELQQKKAALMDNVLDVKTSFISQMSKEDIMNLFN